MTREEQIQEVAATCYRPDFTSKTYVINAFREGVKWADSHPNWHKYPEDKPKKYDDYTVYLEDSEGNFMMETYEYDPIVGEFGYVTIEDCGSGKWKSVDGLVKAWKELPQPPKFK